MTEATRTHQPVVQFPRDEHGNFTCAYLKSLQARIEKDGKTYVFLQEIAAVLRAIEEEPPSTT